MQRLATAVLLLIGAAVLVGCSPLTAYNALAPVDSGAVLATSDVVYGPLERQTLDVYKPADARSDHPVVVFFYGGSWNSGRKEDYAFLGKALASRGFVTVIADYRLVPSVRFPAFLEDGARAVVWAHDNAVKYGGDPSRLFLFGHSAGAYNAVMIALDGHYLKEIGSSPLTITAVAALSGPYDFLPLDVPETQAAFGQANDLSRTQPTNLVSSAAPPMFLATGADDTTVEPRNTRVLAEKLNRVGGRVTVKTYPTLGHIGILLAISKPFRSNAAVLNDVTAYFASFARIRSGKT